MAVAALIAIAALLIWAFGSTVTRFTGAGPLSVAILTTGIAAWLLGYWIWAYKHKTWRTRLALNAYSLPALHHLAPIGTNRSSRPTAKWPSQR